VLKERAEISPSCVIKAVGSPSFSILMAFLPAMSVLVSQVAVVSASTEFCNSFKQLALSFLLMVKTSCGKLLVKVKAPSLDSSPVV
jgi:hypothetical protein